MAQVTTPNASPRDHIADADPSLSRKRARLSEEAHSPTSQNDEIRIEALPLDDEGADLGTAIEIDADDNSDMDPPYSFNLDIWPNAAPIEQIRHFRQHLDNGAYLDARAVGNVCKWMRQHLIDTADHSTQRMVQEYLNDISFFGEFALFAYSLLDRQDWFEYEAEYSDLTPAIWYFLDDLAAVSARFLFLLPGITRERLARRDSTQSRSSPQYSIPTLHYINVLAALTCGAARCLPTLRTDTKLLQKRAVMEWRSHLDAAKVRSLVEVFCEVAKNAREVKDSWTVLHAALGIFHFTQDLDDAGDILAVVNECILPIVCEKHPRALPGSFHTILVKSTAGLLYEKARQGTLDASLELYERYVKKDGDAMIPTMSDNVTLSESLHIVCKRDPDTLAALLSATWTMQAYKAFVFSSIMDIRSCGISLMSEKLLEWHAKWCKLVKHDTNQAVVDFVARFIRVNDLTSYIFGPESHASIVSHSNDIIAFLAATFHYTDHESDIIWQACTTSVEADFTQASLGVLDHVGRYASYDQLFYMTRKFASAPIGMLVEERPAEILATFLRKLRELCSMDQLHQCARDTAELAVQIIRRLHADDRDAMTRRAWGVAMTDIAHLVTMRMDDRVPLYELCVPDILDCTAQSTCSHEILSLFIKEIKSDEEANFVLATLPPIAVLEEASDFLRRSITDKDRGVRVQEIAIRLDTTVSLLSLGPCTPDPVVEDRLFDLMFGEKAPSAFVRHAAWARLGALRLMGRPYAAADYLLEHYISDRIAMLPAAFATLPLVELSVPLMEKQMHASVQRSDPLHLLQDPLWNAVIRFATESPDGYVANCAVGVICHVLFDLPHDSESTPTIVQCHEQFIHTYIEQISSTCNETAATEGSDAVKKLYQSLLLLSAILKKSRDTHEGYQSSPSPQSCVLSEGQSDDVGVHFTAQVTHPCKQPQIIKVQAQGTDTVARFVTALDPYTGVRESRIIVRGRQLDLEAESHKPLAEIIAPGDVIMICPRHSCDTNLDEAFPPPGAIERAIMSQYDRLECFLDGPPIVAKTIYGLLTQLRPSKATIARVSSGIATVDELFPPRNPWRTAFSSHILRKNLKDFARLAVADEHFIIRAIRLYCDFLTDAERSLDPPLLSTLLSDMFLFLQSMPVSNEVPALTDFTADVGPEELGDDKLLGTFADDPVSFVARLRDILRQNLQMPPTSARSSLTVRIYEILVKAMQLDRTLWTAFVSLGEEELSALHAQLLLDGDLISSARLTELIINFCAEVSPPTGALDFYWRIMSRSVPKALEHPFTASAFFKLATELLSVNPTLQENEASVRNIIQTLTSELWQYKHVESPIILVVDSAAVGLLGLLYSAVVLLKSFKKPLACEHLSIDLMNKLLFPTGDQSSAPLLSEDSRQVAFDIVKATCEKRQDSQALALTATSAMQAAADANPTLKYPGHNEFIKSSQQCTGLTNLGMTCYMNSLLQQMFANLAFRRLVFDTAIVDAERQVFLLAIRDLFTKMQDANSFEVSTKDLASVLNIQTDSQEDVHGFYAIFLSRLEDSMPDRESRKVLNEVFAGTFKSQVKGECGHVSTQSEAFNDVSITLKNKASLQDSLAEFVQGEPMQGANRYRCHTCDSADGGRLVNAMKRTALDKVPNNLTFCLKRFTFEAMMGAEGKVNDKFEFPQTIDMSIYETEHLEQPGTPVSSDPFELVGVIVHQGSLQFGHYWSYVRLRGPDAGDGSGIWVLLEDRFAKPCPGGVAEVQEQCFGGLTYTNGQERTDNAYVLFYQRKQHLEEQAGLAIQDPVPQTIFGLLPPRVSSPQDTSRTVFNDNLHRLRIDQVFNPQFSRFVTWLLESLPDDPDSEAVIVELATAYLLRVALCNQALAKRYLTTFLAALTTRLAGNDGSLAEAMVRSLSGNAFAFGRIWCHLDSGARNEMSRLVLSCLSTVRECERSCYLELVAMLVSAHMSVRDSEIDSMPSAWSDYLNFVVEVATAGSQETAMFLDHGYLTWACEILFVTHDASWTARHPMAAKKTRAKQIELGPFFNLLSGLLAKHVDFEADPTPQDSRHQITDENKVILSQFEHQCLSFEGDVDASRGQRIWLLGYYGSQRCSTTHNWEAYPPGKLLRLFTAPGVQEIYRSMAHRMLLSRYVKEDTTLAPMLQMTLHYCASAVDRDLVDLFHELGKNLVDWNAVGECMDFYEIAVKMKPRAVIQSVPMFVPAFIFESGRLKARQKTLAWLGAHVFVDPDPDSSLVAVRTRIARMLAKMCLPKLEQAYHTERVRRQFEQALGAMKVVYEFLLRIREAWHGNLRSAQEEGAVQLSREHLIEYEESRSTIKALEDTLESLQDWSIEPMNGVGLLEGMVPFKAFTEVADDSEAEAGDTDLEEEEEYMSEA